MKIKHRVTLNVSPAQQEQLARLAVRVDTGFQSFEVTEDQERWPRIEELIVEWSAVDVVSTHFTATEVRRATWLCPRPAWQMGYPQPEAAYKEVTYMGANACTECGVGLVQVAPFRMSGEPEWGSRQLGQLHWVNGEWFLRPELFRAHFEAAGLKAREVLHSRTSKPLDSVLQLVVDVEADLAEPDGLACSSCGSFRRPPPVRGTFPALCADTLPDSPALRVRSWFGAGATSYRPVLLHRDLCSPLLASKVKGARFLPVASHPSRGPR